jgi:thymidylate kinase
VTSIVPRRVETFSQLPELTPPSGATAPIPDQALPQSLLEQLALALDAKGVTYCQWKGHWSAHRWATGHGDVDLLVARETLKAFREVLGDHGFKLALPGADREIPGVETYFRIPSPTCQFLIFVLRMMLRQIGRPLLSARRRWRHGIQIQLESLEACSDRAELASVLQCHFPVIDLPFFDRCVRSLRVESSPLDGAMLPWLLHRRLRAHCRLPSVGALASATADKLAHFQRTTLRRKSMRPAGGGIVIALVGGDGAGKSTCARELTHWLAPAYPTLRAHLGNPPRSLLTLVIGGALKLQQGLHRLLRRPLWGYHIESLRHLCTARDRHRLYNRAHRFAGRGGIAICERYPIQQNRALVGPSIQQGRKGDANWLTERLRSAEVAYYERILRPDILCVLRLDPELAVARKPEEPADYVRVRARVIWETDWSCTEAQVVDASQPLEAVIQRLKAIIWSTL